MSHAMRLSKALASILLLSLFSLLSCEDWIGIEPDFTDPQEVQSIADALPQELLDAFGEENIHFGPTPPDISDLSFKVEGLDYEFSKRYLFGPTLDDPYILSHATPPTYDATIFYHHFMKQTEHIAQHKLKTIDPSQNILTRHNDTVYVIGHDSFFTVYYQETIHESSLGIPTNYIIISAELAHDTTHQIIGVKNYRIGKLIKSVESLPITPSYAPGTIEIKQHLETSPVYLWDTIPQRIIP